MGHRCTSNFPDRWYTSSFKLELNKNNIFTFQHNKYVSGRGHVMSRYVSDVVESVISAFEGPFLFFLP